MNETKKISALNVVLVVQLVVMIALLIIITLTITQATKQNSTEHMQTVTSERAQIILSYVHNAEDTLNYYAQAEQITNLLKDPTNPELAAKAQKYTEAYSAAVGYRGDAKLEGIYASEWNTHVLTHTNAGTIGIVTRKDEGPLNALHESLLAAGDGVYNTGIILSPATGKQIVSMYKGVYDENGQPIGLVGLGIFTGELIKTLDDLSLSGADNSFYSMVNVQNNQYVFNGNPDLVFKEVDNKNIKELCKKLSSSNKEQTGSFEYTKDGIDYVSIYSYIPEYGWLLMLDDTKSEVYSLTSSLRIYMIIFAAVLVGLMIVFSFINKRQEKTNQKLAATIARGNKTKESLYTAMFNDVLTDVSNRIKLSMDLDEMNRETDKPYFFAMFNIADFSVINSQFGNDTGDWLLVKTVDTLKQVFKGRKIYRTGSDEFVVAMQMGKDETSSVMNNVNDALSRLSARQNLPGGKKQAFNFKASVVKKDGALNTSIITVLKDMINRYQGQPAFTDMDQLT